jgi:hypothetical protein
MELFFGAIPLTKCSKGSCVTRKGNKAIRRLQYNKSCNETYNDLKLFTVSLYIYQILLFTKSHIDDIKVDTVNHAHDTRNKNKFLRPLKHNTCIFEKSVSFAGVYMYNLLPIEVKNLGLHDFKKTRKKLKIIY